MHLIQPQVATTCIGMAASMGAVLLGGGAKGKRSALPNSRILIHQASAGFQGTASDIEVQAREIIRMNARLQEMMAADTGQSVERIAPRHQPRLLDERHRSARLWRHRHDRRPDRRHGGRRPGRGRRQRHGRDLAPASTASPERGYALGNTRLATAAKCMPPRRS